MRVAVVCPRTFWDNGGIQKAAMETALEMNGVDTTVFLADPTRRHVGEHCLGNAKVKVFPAIFKPYSFSLGLYKWLKAGEFDIIHAHSFTTFPPFAAALAKSKARLVLNPHFHPRGSATLLRIARHFHDPLLGKYILKKADKIICVSESEKLALQKKFNVPDSKIRLIPNGINSKKISSAKKYFFPKKLLLYVGRLQKYKHIGKIVSAMPHLPDEYSLLIIGRGEEKNALERQIVSLGLCDRVSILENESEESKYRWLKTCTALVSLSEHEAFGITLLEALAAGRQVLASDIPAFLELAKKFPGSVSTIKSGSSPKEVAVAIQGLQEKNRKPEISSFEWGNIARLVKSEYEALLKC